MSEDDPTAVTGPARTRRNRRAAAVTAAVLVAGLVTSCSTAPAGEVDPARTPAASPVDPSPAPSGGSPGDSPTPSPAPEATADPTGGPSPEPTPGPESTPSPEPTPEPSAAPEPSTPPPPAPPPPPEPAPAPAPEPAPEPTLRNGDEGPAVLALQQRLIELGYFLPSADGIFGPATEQAVWALQKAAGVTRDGLVGPVTRGALDAGTRPAPRTTAGRTIEVDLDRQLVLAVDEGVVTRIFNASSGNGETYQALGRTQRAYTPTGDFTVVRQIDAMHESTLGLGSMYRPKYFHRGWAVHGSGYVPPWPASHGCVRVSNAAISWIWDVWGAPIGTRVLVY